MFMTRFQNQGYVHTNKILTKQTNSELDEPSRLMTVFKVLLPEVVLNTQATFPDAENNFIAIVIIVFSNTVVALVLQFISTNKYSIS